MQAGKHQITSRLDEHVFFFDEDFQSGKVPILRKRLACFITILLSGIYIIDQNAILSLCALNPFLMKLFLK